LILAIDLLKPGGSFICKFYTGPEDHGLEHRLRKSFTKVFRDKPEACRPESKECYFICVGKLKDLDKREVFS
jgi:21S rRNA (uridine2791-2'-O)-methyltransferase